jgi:hypothetical protein
MLMVVIGAGASYDSIPALSRKLVYESRPPLANELFEPREMFANTMLQVRRILPIVPLLQNLPVGRTVEQVLEQLQAEADDYPERRHQLAAVRYYLQVMLWTCVHQWNHLAKGVTNYKALMDQIERWRKPNDQVCLATFNYDRMIEEALPVVGVDIIDLPDYISNDRYKLLKLHGSVDWGRSVDTAILGIEKLSPWEIAYKLIDDVHRLRISNIFHIVKQYPISKLNNVALFPAMAIPVQSKLHFECPTEHLTALREFIPKTTKLLMIGWSATERHFLKLLAEGITQKLKVMAVAGDLNSAKQSVANLRNAGIDVDAIESPSGFTEFIVSREGDQFLSS